MTLYYYGEVHSSKTRKRETRKPFSRSRLKKCEVFSRFIFKVSRLKNAKWETRKLILRFLNQCLNDFYILKLY